MSNDESDLFRLIDDVADLAARGHVQWAVDLGGAALMVAHEQNLAYIPTAPCTRLRRLPGDGKTDTKDAAVFADQARMRRDMQPFRQRDEMTVGPCACCARGEPISPWTETAP